MPRDLRTYLAEHERDHPDSVLRVGVEIAAAQEVTALVTALEREQKYPIVVLENVRTAGWAPVRLSPGYQSLRQPRALRRADRLDLAHGGAGVLPAHAAGADRAASG